MKEFIKTKWGKAAIVIIILQLIASVIFEVELFVLNLLPNIYLAAIGTLFLLLLLLDFKLIFSTAKKTSEKDGRKSFLYTKRVIGTVIASLVVIGSVVGSVAVGILGNTLGDIFSDVKVETETINTYVLKKDPAETIQDAADYTFGVTKSVNWDNTKKAIRDINKQLGTEIKTKEFESVFAMVDALKKKKIGALLLNEAYVSVLEDVKKYENFSKKTKILHSIVHKKEEKVEVKEDVTEKPFIVYLSGSDTRENKLKAEKARSDVNLLAFVHPKTKQILLLSTPRDSYVYTPVSGDMRDKLTHCGIYGIDCSIGALENLYGIKVTHNAQINFTGFEKLIDALDGVDCYSEKETYTREGHFHLDKGMNHMSGEVALAFVRDRFTYPDGDFARSRHQMEVIRAVVEKVTSASTFVEHYADIMKSLKGMFTTDFQSDEFSALAKMQLSDMAKWNIQSFTIDGEGTRSYTYSMPTQRSFVMHMNPGYLRRAKELMQKVMNGETLTEEEVKKITLDMDPDSGEGGSGRSPSSFDEDEVTGRPITSGSSGSSGSDDSSSDDSTNEENNE